METEGKDVEVQAEGRKIGPIKRCGKGMNNIEKR